MAVKTANDSMVLRVSAAPSAGARNGAEHGVATTVASTPVKNEPAKPDLHCRSEPTPVALRPNSKTPLMFIAKMSITAARP